MLLPCGGDTIQAFEGWQAKGRNSQAQVLEDSEARQLHLGLLPPAPPEKDPMYEHHVRGFRCGYS